MRLAAILATAAATIGAIGVVDLRRGGAVPPGCTSSSPVEKMATRGRARDVDFGEAAGRQHADLARADLGARAQHGLAARHVGAGDDDELSRRGGAAHLDAAIPTGCVCSIITIASAPRGTGPPVAIGVARPGRHAQLRRDAAGDHFVVQRKPHGRCLRSRRAISAARRAKPSTLERSKGGTSMGASTSCARTRPSACSSAQVSCAISRGKSAASNRATRVFARQDGEELVLREARVFGWPDHAQSSSGSAAQISPAPRPSLPASISATCVADVRACSGQSPTQSGV